MLEDILQPEDPQEHENHEENSEENSENTGQKKKKTRLDKLVMGTILGVAIGSVVGMSFKNQQHDKNAPSPEKARNSHPPKEEFRPQSRLGKFLQRLLKKNMRPKNHKKTHARDYKKIPHESE